MSKQSTSVRFITPIIIIALAAALAFYMVNSKPPVAKKTGEQALRKVTVAPVSLEEVSFPVTSQGTTLPAKHIRYLAEVNGKIVETANNWQDGGFFRKGDLMLVVEDNAYQSQLAKAKAAQEQARTALTQEIANAHVAKKTLESSGRKYDNDAARALALREPQLETARAQLASAEVDVQLASLMLEKTYIRAPFDGIMNNKAVDLGQVVGSGQLLADFYGVEKAEIRVPLTLAQQAYLDLPPLAQQANIPVEIIYKTAEVEHRLEGKLVRTSGVLDETTRVLHGIIEIEDVYNLHGKNEKTVLPIGAFVEVEIASKRLPNISVLPSRLLRPGNRIWVADSEDKLRLREVKLLPSSNKKVYVRSGFLEGDRVVVSSIVDAHAGSLLDITYQDAVSHQEQD